MPVLIFLTGFMGCGKSHAARTFSNRAHCIDGDHLFSTSHRILRPDMPQEEKNDWDKWPHDKRDSETLRQVFSESLVEADPSLSQYDGNVIADGAIFVYDWFRVPLIEAMDRTVPFDRVHLLYLNVSDKQLFDNIHRRGKVKQIKKYSDVAAVARDNDGFKKKFGATRRQWDEFTSYSAFEQRIRAILEKPNHCTKKQIGS